MANALPFFFVYDCSYRELSHDNCWFHVFYL